MQPAAVTTHITYAMVQSSMCYSVETVQTVSWTLTYQCSDNYLQVLVNTVEIMLHLRFHSLICDVCI